MEHKVLLCGLGVIGSNVGYNLLMSDSDLKLSAVDADVVEPRNLLAQTHSKQFVGQPKTDAFVAEIYMRTGKMPKGLFLKQKFTEKSTALLDKVTLVIDAFDNYPSRDAVQKLALSKPVVHLGFGFLSDKPIGTILWSDLYRSSTDATKTIDVCEIGELTPWLKGAAAIMSLNIISYLHSGEQKSLFINPDLSVKILN